MKLGEPVSPLLLDRYELKYIIPMSLVDEISAYCERFCILDHYSEIAPDKFYAINSLYFDTPDYLFLRTKLAGYANRFSMRVRSYGLDPKPPYYMEVKRKTLGYVKKTRGKITREDWSKLLLECPAFDEEVDSHKNIDLFVQMALSRNATPKLLCQYRRKAYLSIYDDYARVTFDRGLRYMRTQEYTLKPVDSAMTHYDHEVLFDDHDGNVILELKAPPQVPKWMIDLIRIFKLDRCGFSKYASAMTEVICEDQRFRYSRSSTLEDLYNF